MKRVIIFTRWMEIESKNRDEIEKIIREINLNVTLKPSRYERIKITSEDYRDLWLLLFYISNIVNWEIM